ncbi:MAG: phage portal protein, partial [Oscillospiraceae bacterium]|nr:phage portal protein [Oscillospiraceae bacterium]
MLTPQEIKSLLDTDKNSKQKHHARIGQEYYDGEHAIKNYRIFYYDDEGNLQEDKTRSNIKISHCFFTEIADQEVQYLLSGKDGFLFSQIPELQSELDNYFNDNDDFISELTDALTDAVVKGWAYLYAYRNSKDKLSFQCADSLNVIEADGRFTSDGKDYYIYHYLERINIKGDTVRKIEVWDDKQTFYFVQINDGTPELDKSKKINPRPHVIYQKDNEDTSYFEGLGFIPFFRLDNNKQRISGLKPVKALIDDYDIMACGLSNNLQDLTEGIYVVKGYEGASLDEVQQNLKTKKIIGVDSDGDVDIRTINIPVEARKAKLELDEKNIYRFGMGFNSAQLGDGNITNI